MNRSVFMAGAVCLLLSAAVTLAAQRAYRLPAVDIKQKVIWGAVCEEPEGGGLSFGGQDQQADDGVAHTQVKHDGRWIPIIDQLRGNNTLQSVHDALLKLAADQKAITSRLRAWWFKGFGATEGTAVSGEGVVSPGISPTQAARAPAGERDSEAQRFRQDFASIQSALEQLEGDLSAAAKQLQELSEGAGYFAAQAQKARQLLLTDSLTGALRQAKQSAQRQAVASQTIAAMHEAGRLLEQAAEMLDAEPPPRALSPIVYDPKTRLYVLFGGDHCDYLMNDTWVFDPAKRMWMQRHPARAPQPRANHQLKANGDGTITLVGGYTYTSSTDYCGGQYRDIDDGPWTYDVASNTWSGVGESVAPNLRVYRRAPFIPEYFLEGPPPDAAAQAERLRRLPVNTWVYLEPPRLPKLNRDWGTAVYDPDHDVILRFSGGHSAHGGTDVLHYHCSTNRWELCFPVEFPLGQLYSNTSYPEGFNFNRRPWVTGHTYQSYAYELESRRMLFVGQRAHTYLYDPTIGDWVARAAKPEGMSYDSCFYTLTLCSTPRGTFCWTKDGLLFRYVAQTQQWQELVLRGKLPGAVVDNSTLVYDSRRDRLLFFVKQYGDKHRYDGCLHTVDLKTLEVSRLTPEGSAAASAIPYLCQIRYDSASDLLLVGATLPPGEDGLRRTPAYDCAANRWVSLRITGQDPSGPQGRNVSLGLMYDQRRGLFWAVDTDSRVFALRLEPKSADMRLLQ